MSVFIIGLLSLGLGFGTYSYFSDKEVSTGNWFTAGEIDISINPAGGQDVITLDGSLDLKPCETGYTTTTITNVGPNPAEIWKHIANVDNQENTITDAEGKYYAEHAGSDTWLISDWIHYDMIVCIPTVPEIFELIGDRENPTPPDFYLNDPRCPNDPDATVTKYSDCGKVIFDIELAEITEAGESYDHTEFSLVISSSEVGPPLFQVGTGQMFGGGSPPMYQDYPWWPAADPTEPTMDLPEGIVIINPDTDNPSVNGDGKFHVEIPTKYLGGCGATYYWSVSVFANWYSDTTGWHYYGYSQYPANWNRWKGVGVYAENHAGIVTKEISEAEGWTLTGTWGVASQWIYLGTLEPDESMIVVQSYHLDASVDNWGQSDRVVFDMEFVAQQTEGDTLPPAPGPVLPGHGR